MGAGRNLLFALSPAILAVDSIVSKSLLRYIVVHFSAYLQTSPHVYSRYDGIGASCSLHTRHIDLSAVAVPPFVVPLFFADDAFSLLSIHEVS